MDLISNIVTCRLCEKAFTAPASLIITPGQRNSQVEQFTLSLAHHIINGHPLQNKAIENEGYKFVGMLRLRNYRLTDETLIEQRDRLRWSVHQATLNATFSDEKIEAFCDMMASRCAEIMRDPAIAETERVPMVKGLMGDILLELRDKLQEPGRYTDTEIVSPSKTPL